MRRRALLAAASLGLLLPVPGAAGDGDSPPPEARRTVHPGEAAPGEAPPAAAGERLARALGLLAAPGGPALLAAEAAGGPGAVRRAALEALATLGAGAFPGEGVAAALSALGSDDPLLRAAAVRALEAAGPAGEAALAAAAAAAGAPPALPRERALEALFEVRRGAFERAFLAAWVPSDGTFRGMFAPLGPRGGVAARVLTAVALDRRMAGGAMLGFGPYAWRHPPSSDRERSEIRFRALDALVDLGDPEAREALRGALRARPAAALHDDFDEDPIPAPFDDALRDVIAALGDAGPLREMMAASEEGRGAFGRGVWSETLEMRRRARAWCTLAESTALERARTAYYTEADSLYRRSMEMRRRFGFPVDGVDWYNLACLLARRDRPGDRAEALSHLRESVKTHSVSADWVSRDGDLANLRGEPGFAEVIATLRKREEALEAPPAGGR